MSVVKKDLPQEVLDRVRDLMDKGDIVCSKTSPHSNLELNLGDFIVPVKVDDFPLLYIGCALLPNIVNYLVNILPQFFYPYIVSYLQDLSELSEDPLTVNDVFDIVKQLRDQENGNILDSSTAEDQAQ